MHMLHSNNSMNPYANTDQMQQNTLNTQMNSHDQFNMMTPSQQADYLQYVHWQHQMEQYAQAQHAQMSPQFQQWMQMNAAQQYQYYQQLQMQQQLQYQRLQMQSHMAFIQNAQNIQKMKVMKPNMVSNEQKLTQNGSKRRHRVSPPTFDVEEQPNQNLHDTRQTTPKKSSTVPIVPTNIPTHDKEPNVISKQQPALSTQHNLNESNLYNQIEWLRADQPLPTIKDKYKGVFRATKSPKVAVDPMVMPRANEETTYLAPTHCVIFDREGYKQFFESDLESDQKSDVKIVKPDVKLDVKSDIKSDIKSDVQSEILESKANDITNSPSTLNGNAAEFVPSPPMIQPEISAQSSKLLEPEPVVNPVVEPVLNDMDILVRELLDDALINGALALEMEETVATLLCAQRMMDPDYLLAIFGAVLRPDVLRKIMTHELGPQVTAPLFGACDDEQKKQLIGVLCPGDSLLYVACNKFGYASLLAMIPAFTTTVQLGLFIEAMIRNMETLGTNYYGVRLLADYFDNAPVEGTLDVLYSIVKHIDLMANNEYGWYCFYRLLTSEAGEQYTNPIKDAIFGKYAQFCQVEWGAKVVEQCLRHSLAADQAGNDNNGWSIVIMTELFRAAEDLVSHEYGKHVFHLALISKVQENPLRELSLAELRALKETANAIYERYLERVRMEKHGSRAGSRAGSRPGSRCGSVEVELVDAVELSDADYDEIVQTALSESNFDGDVLEFVEFEGFADDEEEQ